MALACTPMPVRWEVESVEVNAPGGAVKQGDGPRSPELAQAVRPLADLQTPSGLMRGDSSVGGNSCSHVARLR
jgi:hypothetical protein